MASPTLDANSNRTRERAAALAWARGCFEDNPCWTDCLECARDCIIDDDLDEWDRAMATTSNFWRYTHGVR